MAQKITILPLATVVLADAAQAIERLWSIHLHHQQRFEDNVLGIRLQIGLHLLHSHSIFAITLPAKKGQGRKKKTPSPSTDLTPATPAIPTSFESWLAQDVPWLKRPTAYKYMTAVCGLGLDHTATPRQLAAALKLAQRQGKVSLNSLCLLALQPFGPPPPPPLVLQQAEFDFLRQSLSSFRAETDSLCRLKDQLDAYPDFKRAATARLYAALRDLTGTDWSPSTTPDPLALIDPDSIQI